MPELCAAAASLSLKPHSDEAIAIEDSDAEDTCIRTSDAAAVKIYLEALQSEVQATKVAEIKYDDSSAFSVEPA